MHSKTWANCSSTFQDTREWQLYNVKTSVVIGIHAKTSESGNKHENSKSSDNGSNPF